MSKGGSAAPAAKEEQEAGQWLVKPTYAWTDTGEEDRSTPIAYEIWEVGCTDRVTGGITLARAKRLAERHNASLDRALDRADKRHRKLLRELEAKA
jgi:hypothetical protein